MAITGIDTIEGKQIIAAGAVSAKSAEMAYNDENGNPITGYLSAVPEGYATEDWVTAQGYLTEHQSLDGLMSADLLESSGGLITGYNGTAFAGQGGGVTGDYVPTSATNVSIGSNNTADYQCLAQGEYNNANTTCLSQGSYNSASNYSLSQGQNNNAESTALAQGQKNSAYSISLAQGYGNRAYFYSVAQGQNNSAESTALAQGSYNSANTLSLAQGRYNTASNYSFAQSDGNSANNYSFAQGDYNTAIYGSLAQGEYNRANNYSLAQGYNNKAYNGSQALGLNNIMSGFIARPEDTATSAHVGGMVIGQNNKTSAGAAFVIGDGKNNNTRSDLFVIDGSGNVSALSGKFYDKDGEIDLTDYQPISSMTAYQSAGDYYSASNPSGFITGVPDTYLQNTDLTISDGKITEISGVPLSAGDELPESVSAATDYVTANSATINGTVETVSSNSGAWGGSALPISAGPGIKFEMIDNTLVASTDETVLYTGNTAVTAFTVSEPLTNFKEVVFYVAPNYETTVSKIVLPMVGYNTSHLALTYHSIWNGFKGGIQISTEYNNTGMTEFQLTSGAWFGWANDAAKTGTYNDAYIHQIIGINRIAGGE